MKTSASPTICSVTIVYLLVLSAAAFGQRELEKTEGITGSLHQTSLGKVVFTAKPVPIDRIKESDSLKAFELKETSDLAISALLATSLTNYLHALAPDLPIDELTRKGNYQVSFFVDGVLVHKDNLPPTALSAETKNNKTVFSLTLINSANPESRWSPVWHRFLLGGGVQALTAGNHLLKLELRPYLRTTDIKVGDQVAAGELHLQRQADDKFFRKLWILPQLDANFEHKKCRMRPSFWFSGKITVRERQAGLSKPPAAVFRDFRGQDEPRERCRRSLSGPAPIHRHCRNPGLDARPLMLIETQCVRSVTWSTCTAPYPPLPGLLGFDREFPSLIGQPMIARVAHRW